MVDITNDGQQSSTDPVMVLNGTTARVTGLSFLLSLTFFFLFTLFISVCQVRRPLRRRSVRGGTARSLVSISRVMGSPLYVTYFVLFYASV